MPVSTSPRTRLSRVLCCIFSIILLTFAATNCRAASIRGIVTDARGAKITGANVALISKGKVVATAISTADGSFQILTGVQGRFYLVVSAKSFRQIETPGFYAGRLDNIERTVVMEPEWVRESIVVTATGTPTPQPQTSSATDVIGPVDLAQREDLVSLMRLMPGTVVTQVGQRGGQTSLFVRGGDSDDNKILIDGVSVGDLGGRFDFGPLSTTAVERAEVYRGPNSNLYGADAESGVVSLTTPHGTTQLSFANVSGRCGELPHLARGVRNCGRAQQSRLPRRFQLAANQQCAAQRRVPCGHDGGQLGLGAEREYAGSRDLALWSRRERRSECLGLPSRCRRGYAKGPGYLHERVG